MRQPLLLIAAVALVGCGKKDPPAQVETEPEPKPAANKPTAAKVFENTLGMKFVPVPGTKVQFCIWETRVKDYAAYAAANAGINAMWKNVSNGQAETHPVVKVSWNDAQEFCAWLTKKELAEEKIKVAQKYRLPTDEEWSMAVGLGKEEGNTPEEKDFEIKDVYPWGKESPPPKGAGNYGPYKDVDSFRNTSPVGSFAASKFGLYDMGGNVWEWCEDWYSTNSPARVYRGGSWDTEDVDHMLSSYRGYNEPHLRIWYYGFRCVLAGGLASVTLQVGPLKLSA